MRKRIKQYISCLLCALIVMSAVTVSAKTYVQNLKVYSNFSVSTTKTTDEYAYRFLDLGFNEKFTCKATGATFDVKLYRVGGGWFSSDKAVGPTFSDQIVNRNVTWCYRWIGVNTDRTDDYYFKFWANDNGNGSYVMTSNALTLVSEEN